MIELTDQQQAELATGRVVVAVPCDPQPTWEKNIGSDSGFWFYDKWLYWSNDEMGDRLNEVLGDDRAPIRIDDKIPTTAGDAIVRDVDVKVAERWEWVVTLERLENSNV